MSVSYLVFSLSMSHQLYTKVSKFFFGLKFHVLTNSQGHIQVRFYSFAAERLNLNFI